MKLFKKLLSYIIAFTMVLSLATLLGGKVYAADTAKHVITINKAPTGRTYAAYQIFNGDYSNGTLSNIGWGNGVDSAKLLSKLAKDTTNFSDINTDSSARTVAEKLKPGVDTDVDTDQAKAFAKYAEESKVVGNGTASSQTTTTSGETTTTNTTITVTGSGYYLVEDTTAASDQSSKNESYTRYIVKVVGEDTDINLKGNVPTVEKKVKDINDSNATSTTEPKNPTDWQDSADYDIGDFVPYQITGTMPSNIDDYTSYKYVFTDTMSKGLTYNAKDDQEKDKHKAVIKIDGKTVTSSFHEDVKPVTKKNETTGKEEPTGETKVIWSIDDIKNIADPDDLSKKIAITPNTKVIVTYYAKLNDNAETGSTGNPNTVDLTYSNNPNKGGDGETGKTPEDKNIVFTYKTVFDKVNENGEALSGAGFTLNKWSSKENRFVATNVEAVKNEAGTEFTFNGLDDGIYQLVESETPAGYNTMKPLEFKITADHRNDDQDKPLTLQTLSMKKMTPTKVDGDQTLELKDNADSIPGDPNAGSMTTNVVNKKGSTLPSTGGMGTTLLYVAGGILVACAAAYVVLNKKRA